MKKFITPLLAFLFTVLFLISCTKEEPLQMDTVQETEQSEVIVEQLDFNSIPELSQALNDVSGKSRLARSYAEKGDSKFWIDEEDVLKLKDSVNNESYSVIIHTDEPTPTSFYNLVVTKRTVGNPIIPFVVEYKFENGNVFSFAEDEEKKFDGTVNIYSLREFANATGLNARNTGVVACFQDVGQRNHTVAGNNSSGSTGGSPSGGTSTTGSPNTSGTVSVTRPHISVSRARSRGSVSVGQGTFYMPPLTSDKKTQKLGSVSKDESTECPEGYVSIPINVIKDIPPSCKSFNFKNVTSNWQAAVVKDFEMGIGVYTMSNLQSYRVKIPLLTFETWSKDRFGNALSSGAAAELAAEVVHKTAQATVHHFKDKTGFTEYGVTRWFEDYLKKEFRSRTDGGTVTRGNPYKLTPKKFQTGSTNGCD